MMMMRPEAVRRGEVGFHGILLAGCMAHDFTAAANPLIRLNMGAGGDFLQENLDGLRACLAFELQGTGGFVAHFPGKDK
jgi:hypothetical protein